MGPFVEKVSTIRLADKIETSFLHALLTKAPACIPPPGVGVHLTNTARKIAYFVQKAGYVVLLKVQVFIRSVETNRYR
jgi:hypothetical protein